MNKIPVSNRFYICKDCDTSYTPKAGNQNFCSKKCLENNRAKRLTIKNIKRTCSNVECGKEFMVRLHSDVKKYCSSSCAAHVNNQAVPKRKVEGRCKICRMPIPSALSYCEQHTTSGSYEPRITKKKCSNNKCNKVFQTVYAKRKFCSFECKTESNKNTIARDQNRSTICPSCGEHKTKMALTCNLCTKDFYATSKIKQWLSGEWSGGTERQLSATVRKYLLEKADYKCSVCGFNESHPDDGNSVLEINHIDGNGSNHRPENLEVLCPNHHALTSSYRGRNKGSGRKVYYVRVAK